MKVRTYTLLLLLILPLFMISSISSNYEIVLTPDEPDEVLIEANGNHLRIQATVSTNITIIQLDNDGTETTILQEGTISSSQTYDAEIDPVRYYRLIMASNAISTVSISVSGIPGGLLFVLLSLLVINLYFYRDVLSE